MVPNNIGMQFTTGSALANPTVGSAQMSPNVVQANEQQYRTTINLDVRQAFNSQPKEKSTEIWQSLENYYKESKFLDFKGDTLEVGGGNGLLWKGRENLLEELTAKGGVLITDKETTMVNACKKISLLQNPKITLEEADVTQLQYQDNAFARVIANFMLYETGSCVHQAAKEIARVLNDQGRAILVTMDETIHMVPLYSTLQKAKELLSKEGVTIKTEFPFYAPAIKPFCLGNALNILKPFFKKITFKIEDNAILIHDFLPTNPDVSGPDFVVKYLQSLAFIQAAMNSGELADIFFEKVRQIVSDEIKNNGAFRITRSDVIIDCQEPVKPSKQILYDTKLKV